jgi:hypothetical protein
MISGLPAAKRPSCRERASGPVAVRLDPVAEKTNELD